MGRYNGEDYEVRVPCRPDKHNFQLNGKCHPCGHSEGDLVREAERLLELYGKKQPLYAILVAPITEMRQAILEGVKKITIREGHRDYRNGQVMLCCPLEPWAVMADIVDVRHTTLQDVTEEEYRADGFESPENMLSGMKRFYPNMTMDSSVTVVRWDNVQGKLYDEVLILQRLREHYPQDCICEDFEAGLVAEDCHVHNENPMHFVGDDEFKCDCHTV